MLLVSPQTEFDTPLFPEEGHSQLTELVLVPINPAAFGYCEGWVLLATEAGRLICLETFGQHERLEALQSLERERMRAAR